MVEVTKVCLLVCMLVLGSMVSGVNVSFEAVAATDDTGSTEIAYQGAGIVIGNGTSFSISNSSYANATLKSTEKICLIMESGMRTVALDIERKCDSNSTYLKLTDLPVNTTFHRYMNGAYDGNLSSGQNGTIEWTQDISKGCYISFKEKRNTIYILPDGTISPPSAPISRNGDIYSLTADLVNDRISIMCDGITFDGNGYKCYSNSLYVIFAGGNLVPLDGITITNCIFTGTGGGLALAGWTGIDDAMVYDNRFECPRTALRISRVTNFDISDNTFTGNQCGVGATFCSNGFVTENTFKDVSEKAVVFTQSSSISISQNSITHSTGTVTPWDSAGIALFYDSDSYLIEGNTISGYLNGIFMSWMGRIFHTCTIRHNTISSSTGDALDIRRIADCRIYQNNILDGSVYIYINPYWDDGSGHGNYWYDYSGTDTDSDGIGDTDLPHRGLDSFPYMSKDAWLNKPPVADAGDDLKLIVGETGSFDGSGSSDTDGTIVTYDWDYGDSSTHGSGSTSTHSYTSSGTYTVTLTVTDDDGATDSDTLTVEVLTISQAIDELVDIVKNLNLDNGIDNSLDKKLDNAKDAVDCIKADKRQDAKNKMEAFVNEVEAQSGNKISTDDAALLLSHAQWIIDNI